MVGVPVAATLSVFVVPEAIIPPTGCVVIFGMQIVTVTAALSASHPVRFVRSQYCVVSSGDTLTEVDPPMSADVFPAAPRYHS